MPDYSVIHADCVDGLKNVTKKIQLTVTSPPYYNVKDYVAYDSYSEYLKKLEDVFTLIYEITDDARMCCVNISNILIQRESRSCESKRIPLAFHFVPLMEKIGWKFIEDIVWIKPEGAVKNRNGGFYQHRQPVAYKPNIVNEYIFIFQKPSKDLIDKVVRSYDAVVATNSKVEDDYERTNVWRINPETNVKHPAPYPEELVERLIKYYSFVGDTVLDPFMGSGTTALVAYKLNRNSIGFEIHKEYIDLFEERMKTVLPNNLIKTIEFNADDYSGLTKEQTIKKLSKFSKKYLLTLLSRKKISKAELVNQIYEFYLNS
jgi:DNA modification methylase